MADQHGGQREGWEKVAAFLQEHPGSVAARVLNTPLTLSLARDAYRHAELQDHLAEVYRYQA